MKRAISNPASGFTLIELMVALVLGLLVIAGVSAVFLGGSRNYREDERVARMHDNTRFALIELTHEIEMASHWAEVFFPPAQDPDEALDPSQLAATVDPAAAGDCGRVDPPSPAPPAPTWVYDTTPGIEILDDVADDGSNAAAAFKCIDADEVVPGTDIISIKRVAGSPTAAADLVDGRVYMRSNNVKGVLFRHPTDSTDPQLSAAFGTDPTTDWAYNVTIYYIRNFFTPGDGIPSLCRKLLQGITVETDSAGCIPGVENLQLEAGLDTDNDGTANFYKAAPTATEMESVASIRLLLLTRTAQALNGYTNAKTYALSNAGNLTPGGPYPRELTSALVNVRNPSALRLF